MSSQLEHPQIPICKGGSPVKLRDGNVSDDADFEQLDAVNVRGNGVRREYVRVRATARLVNR